MQVVQKRRKILLLIKPASAQAMGRDGGRREGAGGVRVYWRVMSLADINQQPILQVSNDK